MLINRIIRHRNTRDKNMKFNSFGIIVPIFCVLILVSCFIYDRVVDKKYIKDGDCTYKRMEVYPKFTLLQTTAIQFDEIKLDNKTIFRQAESPEMIQIQNTFFTGKKRIEIFNHNKSIVVDSICLIDDWSHYWLNIRMDTVINKYYVQLEVFIDD